MTHLLTDNTKIKKNEYNIPEPVDGIEVPSHKIDVVFCTSFGFRQKRTSLWQRFYDIFYPNANLMW
jgi:5-formyltetrahydrofolate cyclo-ligase